MNRAHPASSSFYLYLTSPRLVKFLETRFSSDYLRKTGEFRALDAGCGSGDQLDSLYRILRKPALLRGAPITLIGMDKKAEVVRAAAQTFGREKPPFSIKFLQGDLTDLKFLQEHFSTNSQDLIFFTRASNALFEDVERIANGRELEYFEYIFAEFQRMLKEDGVIIFTDEVQPNASFHFAFMERFPTVYKIKGKQYYFWVHRKFKPGEDQKANYQRVLEFFRCTVSPEKALLGMIGEA